MPSRAIIAERINISSKICVQYPSFVHYVTMQPHFQEKSPDKAAPSYKSSRSQAFLVFSILPNLKQDAFGGCARSPKKCPPMSTMLYVCFVSNCHNPPGWRWQHSTPNSRRTAIATAADVDLFWTFLRILLSDYQGTMVCKNTQQQQRHILGASRLQRAPATFLAAMRPLAIATHAAVEGISRASQDTGEHVWGKNIEIGWSTDRGSNPIFANFSNWTYDHETRGLDAYWW